MGGSNETHSVPVTTPERQSAPSNGVGTQRSPTKHSPLPTKKQLIWSKVEAFAWLCAAAFALWYGNGRNSIVYIIMYDINVKRTWFFAGLGFLGVDFLTFLYLSIWVKRVKHKSKDAAKAAPTVVTTETLSTTAAGIMFSVAFWPVWRFITPLILVVLFMAFTMLAQLRPSTWAYRKKREN